MSYKRKNPFNEVKQEHIKKLELHLKKIDELHPDKRSNRDSVL